MDGRMGDSFWRLAAPSFVLPAGVEENGRFLAGRVDEVALCFFETRACLAYTRADLPPVLAELPGRDGAPLRWQVHLPLDLPWPPAHDAAACRRTARLALRVLARAEHLAPRCAVLHPPAGETTAQRRMLADFIGEWRRRASVPLLLENTEDCDVLSLGEDFLSTHGAAFCLDVGHAMGYAQTALLRSTLPARAAMVHWSAPLAGDAHAALAAWTPEQRQTAARLAARLPRSATHVLELFSWQRLEASLPLLERLLAGVPTPSRLAHP